jgi:hypothetical protein
MTKRIWFVILVGMATISYFGGLFIAAVFLTNTKMACAFIILVFLALLNIIRATIQNDENNKGS